MILNLTSVVDEGWCGMLVCCLNPVIRLHFILPIVNEFLHSESRV